MTTSELAQLLGVHPNTVRRKCADWGIRRAPNPGSHRKFVRRSAVSFANAVAAFSGFTPQAEAA